MTGERNRPMRLALHRLTRTVHSRDDGMWFLERFVLWADRRLRNRGGKANV